MESIVNTGIGFLVTMLSYSVVKPTSVFQYVACTVIGVGVSVGILFW